MEWLIQAGAFLLSLLLILLKRFRYVPSGMSDFEVQRRSDAGDALAIAEAQRRWLLPGLAGLGAVKEAVLIAGLATLLVATHVWWAGLLMLLGYWLLIQLVAAKGWLDEGSVALQHKLERVGLGAVRLLQPLLRHFAAKTNNSAQLTVASREDLAEMIERDTKVLSPGEKAGLQAALRFSKATVADVMVPRNKVIVVGASETVGPVLLDRLHKAGHKIFVVVKKDLDHIQGLLYVGDISEPDPDVKTVNDALRPTVHYIAAAAPLAGVLSASLQSGRQLFIVVDENGNTKGLVTLQDAIVKLLGTAPPDHLYTSTDPKKVKQS